MSCQDETRTLRRRVTAIEDDLASSLQDTRVGCVCAVVKTTTVGTYPTASGAYYAVLPVRITGPIGEGLTPTLTAGGTAFYALNVGSAIPASGTYLVAVSAGGRWTFKWDG